MEKQSRSDRLYQFFLRLFPSEFRGDFGGEMQHVFREQRRDAERRGASGLLRLWWETLSGIFRTAPREHVEMFRQDGGYALRMMRKNPGFTAVAVLTLALGIGANTAIFSLVHGVLLKPLPYREGDRIVVLRQQAPRVGFSDVPFSPKEFADYQQANGTLSSLVEYHTMSFILLGGEEPLRVQTGVVSHNFFDFLGVQPLYGRAFREEDEKHGAEAVLMLSYEFWQRRFGGDPKIVGRVFQMNNRPHTAIGVLPPFPQFPDANDVYMPTSACPFRSSQQTRESRTARMVRVFGRLKNDANVTQAQSDLAGIAARLAQEYPDAYPSANGYSASASLLREELTRSARPTFLILLGVVGVVLLIACANVANLILARMAGRERELAIRAALGAGRVRLLRQLLTESSLLALCGGIIGLLVAYGVLDLLTSFAARFTPRANEVHLDGWVLFFTLALSLFTGIVFGSIPALSARRDPGTALHEEGGRSTAGPQRHRARAVLVVAQVALSFILLSGAGLMLRSFYELQQVNAGFDPENVVTARVTLSFSKYTDANRTREFYRNVLERLGNHPEVISRAAATFFPLNRTQPFASSFRIEGRDTSTTAPALTADAHLASTDYFRTLGIPLVRGRLFEDRDSEPAPRVGIINQTMARQFWGKDDPIGQRVTFDRGQTWITIVGIVADTNQYGLDQSPGPEIYQPFEQVGFAGSLLVRSTAEPSRIEFILREAVRAVDPEQPLDRVRTLVQVRSDSLASPRLTATLLGVFAGAALAITIAGIGGVMALSVSQRRHEIGIRIALGATPAEVMSMVLGQGLRIVVIGLLIGAVGGLALTRVLEKLLFHVEPSDPLTFAGVALVLALAAAIACLVPARRAAGIDPMLALRTE